MAIDVPDGNQNMFNPWHRFAARGNKLPKGYTWRKGVLRIGFGAAVLVFLK
jgi:hypothetical protein